MERKYQVFISSTYTDLIEERKKAVDILLMADCIPAGMEAFVATDLEQFDVIKKVIDLCDYYVLIIGKRYGSINPETGISYTEMEYDYAISKDIPVLVFSLDTSVELPPEKCDSDPIKTEKLQAFRNRALNNRLASIWKDTEDLTGALAISIMKAKNEISRPGWQRGTDYDEASLRREIMELNNQVKKLEDELNEKSKIIQELTEQKNLAFDNYPIVIKYHYYNLSSSQHGSSTHYGEINTSLEELFSIISTEMMGVMITEKAVEDAIMRQFPFNGSFHYLSDSQFLKRILNHYEELGLMYSNWSDTNNQLYWGLTEKGRKTRNDMILIRKNECTAVIE